ncbi:MAG: ABC transporter permease, partial [Thioalkalivibrio sp.]|nr:ABC transporter permease [Thioalkalivibrio sp.]
MERSRGYHMLLRLLPRDLRARFGRDMEELFLARLGDARSPAGRAWVWSRAVSDVVGVALGEGMTTMKTRMTGKGGGGMQSWMQDLRYALRTLGRSPALTVLIVGTLAIGIGTSTATFSVVNGVMLKPLPYGDPDRLVAVWPEQNFNTAMMRELLDAAPALESATGISGWLFTLTGEGEPLQLDGARVSPGHFRVLGVRPVLGRDFTEEEGLPGNNAVTVISHGLWVRAFGADPEVIGRTIDLATNDQPRRTVIGVLPPDFRPIRGTPEVWIPLALDPSRGIATDSTWYVSDRVARLAAGASVEQASEQVRVFARDTHALMDQAIEASSVEVAGVRPLHGALTGNLGGVVWVALGAVSLVLLIACANVANLLLARGEARQTDLAVRTALGAGRERVVRLLLVESGVLGVLGGVLGIGLSYALVDLVVRMAPPDFPRVYEIGVDGAVLAYGLAATAAATLLAGLVPALRVSRDHGGPSLVGSGRSTSARAAGRLTPALLGAEVALAVVVIIGSGLMFRSLHAMTSEDPGVDGRGVLVLRPSPPEGRYPDGAAFHTYYDEVLE